MQINKVELDMQTVSLLPERETLFFNTTQGNWSNVGVFQSATAGSIGQVNLGTVAEAGNFAQVSVGQGNF